MEACIWVTVRSASITDGGGIYNWGQLNVKDCTVSGITGIGVYNLKGTAYLFGSTISDGSGIIFGGDLINQPDATLTLTDCTVSGGTPALAELVFITGARRPLPTALSATTSRGVTGPASGTAFFPMMLVLILTGCTLEGNTSTGAGSGVAISNGTAMLIDDTIANNQATNSGPGAGLFNSGTATLIACTISGNTTKQTAAASLKVLERIN